METLLEISTNFYNDWKWHGSISVFSVLSFVSQIPVLVTASSIHCFQHLLAVKTNLFGMISHSLKALMALHHAAPKRDAPGFNFLEF